MRNFNNYSSIEIDSRQCITNSIFICNKKNILHVNDAINNGATLIISEVKIQCRIKFIYVDNIDLILTKLLDFFYPYNLKLIGVTGTDGKTSTCLMIKSLIDQNSNCGYIGTNGIIYNNTKITSQNTTPDIITIRKHLHKMTLDNVKYVAMECSSEGILGNRLLSLSFDCLIFTNITHEHLNTHKTMKNYINTKISLINYLKPKGSLFVNGDDKHLRKIKYKNKISFGLKRNECIAYNIKTKLESITFTYQYKLMKNRITIPFFGKYNIYNCLACILVLEKFSLLDKTNFMYMDKISGRFELIKYKDNEIVIDFAHTPNALENLLKNIKSITKKKIILVMGSAGQKDSSKRPLLGSVANRYADEIIITSEDPKNELITNIFSDIICTIKKEYYLVLFRKDAIKIGLNLLNKNSILVIVGKGLENQEQLFNIKFNHNDYIYTKSLLDS